MVNLSDYYVCFLKKNVIILGKTSLKLTQKTYVLFTTWKNWNVKGGTCLHELKKGTTIM